MGNYEEEGWTPWRNAILHIKTHPREIVENVVDIGHFIPVHGTHIDNLKNEFIDHTAVQINTGVAYPVGGGKDTYSLNATYFGPGYQVTHMKGYLESRLINAHTMIDQDTLHLRFAVSLKHGGDLKKTEKFLEQYIENLREGFFQDVRIWENKAFRDRPILCDGDGAIMRLRKWYRQFYQPMEAA
jgi:3-ketosteroid 9alpha-monooxygenase subunit A